jgi:hypothetical protein
VVTDVRAAAPSEAALRPGEVANTHHVLGMPVGRTFDDGELPDPVQAAQHRSCSDGLRRRAHRFTRGRSRGGAPLANGPWRRNVRVLDRDGSADSARRLGATPIRSRTRPPPG